MARTRELFQEHDLLMPGLQLKAKHILSLSLLFFFPSNIKARPLFHADVLNRPTPAHLSLQYQKMLFGCGWRDTAHALGISGNLAE